MILVFRLLFSLTLLLLSMASFSQDSISHQNIQDNFRNADAITARLNINYHTKYQLPLLDRDIQFPINYQQQTTPTAINLLKNRSAFEINNTGQAFIKVLFVYPESLEKVYPNNLSQRFDQILSITNEIYTNSRVKITLQNVGSIKVQYPDENDAVTALYDLTYSKHESFFKIPTLRYELGADLVVFARAANTSNLGGFSWINGSNGIISDYVDSMYSYISIDHFDYIAAHEIGHNFGLRHSRVQDPYVGATFDYALGYGMNNQFITIMAHRSSFNTDNKIYQFSNPDLTCANNPCGIDILEQTAGANATFALNSIRFQAQNLLKNSPYLKTFKTALNQIASVELKNCINENKQNISLKYAGQINMLDCSSAGIDNLIELRDFENIHTLNLSKNKLVSVEELTWLNHLITLDVSNNKLSDVSPLFDKQKHWRHLNLTNNLIYCWQLTYLQKYQSIDNFKVPEQCDNKDDKQDFDDDGINNISELNNNTNPVIHNEKLPSYSFEQSHYAIYENQKRIVIPIYREQGVNQASDIQVSIISEKTSNQDDFSVENLTVSFSKQDTKKLLRINIHNDDDFEGNEHISLSILNKDSTRDTFTTVNIEIIDDDEKTEETVEHTVKPTLNKNSNGGGGGHWSLSMLMCLIILKFLRKLSFRLTTTFSPD